MANLVGIDTRQNPRRYAISGCFKPRDCCRADVKTARFKDHRDNRESRQQIVASRRCGLPKAVMRRKGAVIAPQRNQPSPEQGKMHGLIRANRKPIGHEFARLAGTEPSGRIKSQVDGNELDMRKCMKHRDPVCLRPAAATARHPVWWQQFQRVGPCRTVWHGFVEAVGEASEPPVPLNGTGAHHLGAGIGRQQNGPDGFPDGPHRKSCAALPR